MRSVSIHENCKNLTTTNSLGYNGLKLNSAGNYEASIKFEGIRYHLGTYVNIEDAIIARRKAEQKYGFISKEIPKHLKKSILKREKAMRNEN